MQTSLQCDPRRHSEHLQGWGWRNVRKKYIHKGKVPIFRRWTLSPGACHAGRLNVNFFLGLIREGCRTLLNVNVFESVANLFDVFLMFLLFMKLCIVEMFGKMILSKWKLFILWWWKLVRLTLKIWKGFVYFFMMTMFVVYVKLYHKKL